MNIYKSKLITHFIYVTFSPFSFKGTVHLKIKCSLFPPACRAFYSSKLLGYTDVLKAPETKPQSQNTVTMFVFRNHDLVTLKIHKRYCDQFKASKLVQSYTIRLYQCRRKRPSTVTRGSW